MKKLDKKILELWKSPLFSGSFTGIRTFQAVLKLEKNIDVSRTYLTKLLSQEPIFVIHQRKHQNFERRKVSLHNYGELVQCDLAQMFNFNGYIYFLLLIDCYSSKLFVKPLKNKKSETVTKALEEIIISFKSQIYVLESDRGSEFTARDTKNLFKKYNIVYKSKFGQNKAMFAERYIYLVKRRLYMLLRSKLSKNWVKYLPMVIQSLNNLPIKKLGFLKPKNIVSEKSSVYVDKALEKYSIMKVKQPTFEEQLQNEHFDSVNFKTFKIGDYVYKQFNVKLFEKKYNIAVLKKLLTSAYLCLS